MKKFKLVNTFLKVGKIIAIVLIPVFALLLVIFAILGIIGILNAQTHGTSEDLALAIASLVSGIVEFVVFEVVAILGLVFNNIASKGIKSAKSKEEAKKPAIFGIVSGALVTLFGIPAGIIALTMSDADFEEVQAAEPVDVKPADEPAENK